MTFTHIFIAEEKIFNLLNKASGTSRATLEQVIAKALKLKGLTPAETALLLQNTDRTIDKKIFSAAKQIKDYIYGQRLVLFAPLYITNYCQNNCLYCGFRSGNKKLSRKRLSIEEIKDEVKYLEQEGHKRILMVAGEDPVAASIGFLEKAIPAVYQTKVDCGEIRRLNINVAPMSTAHFKRLQKTGIGTYQLFQETYHQATYTEMHPSGNKSNYEFRLYGMHRAEEAGIKDVGIGILFGLADYKFEVLALLFHALELEKQFGVGPHTISIPRIEPALNTPLTNYPPAKVSDYDFKRIIAILRLAVPYTGLILSTRETAKMRNELFGLGISQISAGSRTNPGGYQSAKQSRPNFEQFSLHDNRSLLEVIKDISKMGYSPSFCTACYRAGRIGKDFMDLAKPGLIRNYCLPNSLLTFQEYLVSYGDKEVRQLGAKVINKQLKELTNKRTKSLVLKKLAETAAGKNDLYF